MKFGIKLYGTIEVPDEITEDKDIEAYIESHLDEIEGEDYEWGEEEDFVESSKYKLF